MQLWYRCWTTTIVFLLFAILSTQTSSYVNQQLCFELAQETPVRFKVVYNNKISFVLKEITLNEMISEDGYIHTHAHKTNRRAARSR